MIGYEAHFFDAVVGVAVSFHWVVIEFVYGDFDSVLFSTLDSSIVVAVVVVVGGGGVIGSGSLVLVQIFLCQHVHSSRIAHNGGGPPHGGHFLFIFVGIIIIIMIAIA